MPYARRRAPFRGYRGRPAVPYRFKRFGKRSTKWSGLKRVSTTVADAKYFDVGGASYVNNTTGSITHLDIVPTGTSAVTREGKSFRLRSVWIIGSMQNNSAATTNDVINYLIWDRQPNKALAAITDVVDVATADTFTKRENANRFRIIKKWSRSLCGPAAGTGVTINSQIRIDQFIKLPEECVAMCTAADTTGAIGNRISGALLFLTLGDTAAGTAAAVTTVGFRIGFSEK